MKNPLLTALLFATCGVLASFVNSSENEIASNTVDNPKDTVETNNSPNMKLGAFSVSLNVKDLTTSKEFYEKLGFTILGGSMEQNYLIMKNENSIIGLFQGMFEGNILTFNPGWDEDGKDIGEFDDIREIQAHLKKEGVISEDQIDAAATGPAGMMITDPDGNVILIDQHR